MMKRYRLFNPQTGECFDFWADNEQNAWAEEVKEVPCVVKIFDEKKKEWKDICSLYLDGSKGNG